jgi:hypothetical protein
MATSPIVQAFRVPLGEFQGPDRKTVSVFITREWFRALQTVADQAANGGSGGTTTADDFAPLENLFFSTASSENEGASDESASVVSVLLVPLAEGLQALEAAEGLQLLQAQVAGLQAQIDELNQRTAT